MIDIINNFLAFWPSYYIHIGATFILSLPSFSTEITTFRIEENIIPLKMIKKGSKNITDFLQISNKLSSKKS